MYSVGGLLPLADHARGHAHRDATVRQVGVDHRAGAHHRSPADRDAVDIRIVGEVTSRTGHIIDSQSEVGGWPTLEVNRRTIADGPAPSGDDDGDGYTNFEQQVLFPMAAEVEGRL